MTPDQFAKAGIKLYGHRHWVRDLAKTLGMDRSAIHRLAKGMVYDGRIPGVVEVAVQGLLQHKRANDIIERAARRLIPRSVRNMRKAKIKKSRLPKKRKAGPSVEENIARVFAAHASAAHGAGNAAAVPGAGGEVQGDIPERAGGEGPDRTERDT